MHLLQSNTEDLSFCPKRRSILKFLLLGSSAIASRSLVITDAYALTSSYLSKDDTFIQFEGNDPPLPETYSKEIPSDDPPPRSARIASGVGDILPEYRLIGCPIFACTQRNVDYRAGWYYSFQVPRTGTIKSFMWQTQGARQHADTDDTHTGGTFGSYVLKFYRCTGWSDDKGTLLATANLIDSKFNPGWQYPDNSTSDQGFDPTDPTSPIDGSEYIATLRGRLQVHSWINRVQLLNGSGSTYYYSGGNFAIASISGTWNVQAGDWVLVEFVNTDANRNINFSLDNDAYSPSAPLPGSSGSNSPLDIRLGTREFIPDSSQAITGQPDPGRTEGIVPFYLLEYSDSKWFGQPWYYRGSLPSGSQDGGLFDENATNPSGTISTNKKGPALLVYGAARLRQVLTPPADFAGGTYNQLFAHAWRWTSLQGYTQSGRLGVRILSVNSVSGQDITTGITQVWPSAGAGGSGVFNVNGIGPFQAFSTSAFAAFGVNVVSGKTLDITPSNLTGSATTPTGRPTSTEFMNQVPKMPYGVLNISPSITLTASKRYIIEFMAEPGCAYAMQIVKNPARTINFTRKKSDGSWDKSQGRAWTSATSQKSLISIPQIWPCHHLQDQSISNSDDINNVARYFNCAAKMYDGDTDYVYYYSQALPVCLKPSV